MIFVGVINSVGLCIFVSLNGFSISLLFFIASNRFRSFISAFISAFNLFSIFSVRHFKKSFLAISRFSLSISYTEGLYSLLLNCTSPVRSGLLLINSILAFLIFLSLYNFINLRNSSYAAMLSSDKYCNAVPSNDFNK